MQHRELLKGASLFRDLTDAELESIVAIATPENLVGGDTLFLAGTAPDAIYVIGMGTVELRVADRDEARLLAHHVNHLAAELKRPYL